MLSLCLLLTIPGAARLSSARVLIDQQLDAAGWVVQDKKDLNLFAGPDIAVREVVMKPGHRPIDYLLYVDKAVVGVIEAEPQGTPLSGVEWQSAMYAEGLPNGRTSQGADERRHASARLRSLGHGNPLHQRLRLRSAGATDLQLPQARDPGSHHQGS